MVDLNLKREMSFGTFAKELTGLWGPDDNIDTPKGSRQGIFAAPAEGVKPSRNDSFDMNVLMRSDSKELLGARAGAQQAGFTRSKSRECLLTCLESLPPAMPTTVAPADGSRFTRSLSKENIFMAPAAGKAGTELIRVDSLLGSASFDMTDLLGPDFMAPIIVPAVEPTAQKRSIPAAVKPGQAKRPRTGSDNNSTAKDSKKIEEPGTSDDWIGKQVKLTRGKYEGRSAVVLGKTEKKYQVQVEGVAYQLEFYGTMFVRPEDYTPAAPKRSRKKVAQQVSDRQMSFGLTASQNDISAEMN